MASSAQNLGNVSYALPSHLGFLNDVDYMTIGLHHPKFQAAAGTKSAFESSLQYVKIMAIIGLNILKNAELRKRLWVAHPEKFGSD